MTIKEGGVFLVVFFLNNFLGAIIAKPIWLEWKVQGEVSERADPTVKGIENHTYRPIDHDIPGMYSK